MRSVGAIQHSKISIQNFGRQGLKPLPGSARRRIQRACDQPLVAGLAGPFTAGITNLRLASTRRDPSFPQVLHRRRPQRGLPGGSRYISRVVLMLAVLGLALFGVIRLSQTLEPRQRVVLVFVFILGVAWVLMQLVRLGILGRVTSEP